MLFNNNSTQCDQLEMVALKRGSECDHSEPLLSTN
jgi:hypothetical protein